MKAADLYTAGLKSEKLEVPGWPEPVIVRELGALDAIRWKRTLTVDVRTIESTEPETVSVAPATPEEELRKAAHLVALCTFDQEGARIFTEGEIDRVANLPDPVIGLLTKVALRVNGLSAEAIERAEQDFAAAPS